jgi:hypothetical protein
MKTIISPNLKEAQRLLFLEGVKDAETEILLTLDGFVAQNITITDYSLAFNERLEQISALLSHICKVEKSYSHKILITAI